MLDYLEKLQLLQESGSYDNEIAILMEKKKVLVKIHLKGKYIIDIASNIDIN
ncbi:hypothetical protein RhiirA5_425462 [Rhizophagus irregularis]|uniref:Uncharacterized protein n=1 Tax=Rhizophagus irregularis TaxID=588596 RepID=A0A2I1F7H2_9GLOM|nr:hypothetical protein RhiirA5_425462 [Rhizophagus irregularis]PKC69802.1 hypothetical protein RhiirA1_455573 [Rhizophagus irregularis]PKY30326.1 hypothetical protein RhiirB3_447359 [Rhizophagus irregularis]